MISSTLHHLAFVYVENHVELEQGKFLHIFVVLTGLKQLYFPLTLSFSDSSPLQ